jgi:isoleucyl-tRNA synthetase
MESGTGLVHTAPAHGMEDYIVGKEYGLDLECEVDDNGLFTKSVGSTLEGKSVLGEGNAAGKFSTYIHTRIVYYVFDINAYILPYSHQPS